MSVRKINEIMQITQSSHPLEEHFNIEANSTEIVRRERHTELVKAEEYDEKDCEIEENYQEVYDKAMTTFDNLQDCIEDADTKLVARLSEVSAQHLSLAIQAANQKARLKEHKDKMAHKSKSAAGPHTVNQTVIINRNDLLEQLSKMNIEDVIDGEYEKSE